MLRIHRLTKAGKRLLYKIRHHKGHGIHSPFVFKFIVRVIEEKTAYYAYDDIRKYVDRLSDHLLVETKINRLSFRIVNYFNPQKILELGSGNGHNTLYITAPSSDIECISIELNYKKNIQAKDLYADWKNEIVQLSEEFPKINEKQDCIFIDLKHYKVDPDLLIPYLLSLVKESSFVFIIGIRLNKKWQDFWKNIIQKPDVTVSMDLFYLGILFFDKKYFKRNYKLSF